MWSFHQHSSIDVGPLWDMDVSRWAIDLKLAPADRCRLEDLVRNGNTPQKLVPRARIAFLSDGTRLNGALAQDAGVALPTVHRWQRRVQEQGVDGLLRNKTRPSRIPALPRRWSSDSKLLEAMQRPAPPDQGLLAGETGGLIRVSRAAADD